VILRVYGTPASKGSGRAILRGGKALYLSGGSKQQQEQQQSWERAMRDAIDADGPGTDPFLTPVQVSATFLVARPKAHYRAGTLKATAPTWCDKGKDLDKMIRATLDPLQVYGVLQNDSQVVRVVAVKRYVEAGEATGAIVEVQAIEQVKVVR
jgi:Holliday junction resolvase RusA-like endonuclease